MAAALPPAPPRLTLVLDRPTNPERAASPRRPTASSGRWVLDAYRAGSALARRLPGPAVPSVTSSLALAMSGAAPGRRRMVARHLRRVHGGRLRPDQVLREVHRAFESYARYWVDSFRVQDMTEEEIAAGMSAEGLEHLDAALDTGNGAILALPHLGAWDFGGTWLAIHGYPLTVVVEPLDPPELFEWFAEYRESLGMEVVPLGPDAGRRILRTLRANGQVALLCDRDIGGGGVEVEFFGERTTLPAGPATLALRSGAALLPTAVYYTDDGNRHGTIRPAIDCTRQGSLRDDVARLTQVLAHELEALIRTAPEQWHLFQPNWPSDRRRWG